MAALIFTVDETNPPESSDAVTRVIRRFIFSPALLMLAISPVAAQRRSGAPTPRTVTRGGTAVTSQ
jgi:hypothetical protein